MNQTPGSFAAIANALERGLPNMVPSFIATVALLAIGVLTYTTLTRFREREMIAAGNTAAAILLGGVIVALAIPLAALLATSGAFGMLSVPAFLWAILLIYLFAVHLQLLPASGWVPFAEDPAANMRCFALPALTLALGEWPMLMRVLRSDMIATLQEDYITMAKAKGLTPARILLVHALKPSSLTLVTVAGINIGRLIGGAVIVESIFALPGIGRLLVGSIYARDFVILQGVVLFVAAGFVFVNFAVDMLYAVLDPRIRHGHH